MKKYVLILLLLTLSYGKKLQVVTSIPDIADIVREIGGDKVKVTSLATGREDLHAVPVRPSFLPLLYRADLLITLGLGAEHSWLPALAKKSRNRKIMEGQPGWIELSKGIAVLDKPTKLSRSEGEQHPDGNPHFNVGPHSGHTMAHNVFSTLASADPASRSYYEGNLQRYEKQIDQTLATLKEKAKALHGKKIITYHEDISYLCSFYGLEKIGTIEVKPGVPPTASHLMHLQNDSKDAGVFCIIHNQSQASKLPQKLGRELSVPVVKIANAVGATPEASTWLKLQEYNLNKLLEAVGE